MKKNNFKMRCVKLDKVFNDLYTEGKVYECINGTVIVDDETELWNDFNSFEEFQKWSKSEWELVEDEVENPIKTKFITMSISDTKSIITDNNGIELCICRHYTTDKHDEKYVINELTKRYIDELDRIEKEKNKIKVGDYVVVIDNGKTYAIPNESWFEGIDMKYCLKFAYGILPDNSETTKYKVVAIIEEDKYSNTKYLISNGIVTFLLIKNGLRKVD